MVLALRQRFDTCFVARVIVLLLLFNVEMDKGSKIEVKNPDIYQMVDDWRCEASVLVVKMPLRFVHVIEDMTLSVWNFESEDL